MSGRGRRRLSDTLTGLATLTFPRARRSDARVVRDCAREAVDAAGLRALPRESLSLAGAGLRTRIGLAATELWHAPWRDALAVLALPLAATLLLVWTFGFVPRYDHWPLGEGWVLLLGGSLLAVTGAALQHRWLTAIGGAAVFVAAAAPYVGYGSKVPGSSITPSFFFAWSVDIGAASLLPTLLLVAAALSLPPKPARTIRLVLARLALGLVPATVALVHLLPLPEPEPTRILTHIAGPGREVTIIGTSFGPPYPWPWIPASRPLIAALGIALAVAVIVTWRRARAHPAPALASGLVLLSVAYPVAWVSIRTEGPVNFAYWWYNGAYPLLLAVVPTLLALYLMRRAGRASAGAR
ncbi:MAG TPA: hypothetical protein VK486_09835 [Thermoleophilaceae bacterium]|nr:hypothetical protein [Thermoleophilaceae bacterium]